MIMEEESERINVDKDFLAAELFEAISHPTRIRILRTLSGESLGFAELKHKLGIASSGNLSHHLIKLAPLVEANTQGKYKLTDQGREALYAIGATHTADKNWIATAYAGESALIFYSLYLTAALLSRRVDTLTLLSGLILAIIVFLIFRVIEDRVLRRASPMHWGWRQYEVKQKASKNEEEN